MEITLLWIVVNVNNFVTEQTTFSTMKYLTNSKQLYGISGFTFCDIKRDMRSRRSIDF